MVKYASDLEQKYKVSVWKQRVYVNTRRAAVWLFVGNFCSCRCFASFSERLLFFSFCELYFFLWTLIQYFSCVHLWSRDASKPIFCHFSRLKFVGKLGGSHSFVFGKYLHLKIFSSLIISIFLRKFLLFHSSKWEWRLYAGRQLRGVLPATVAAATGVYAAGQSTAAQH